MLKKLILSYIKKLKELKEEKEKVKQLKKNSNASFWTGKSEVLYYIYCLFVYSPTAS